MSRPWRYVRQPITVWAAPVASFWVAVVGSIPGFGPSVCGQDDAAVLEADIALNEANYEAWRDHILPHDAEMAWEQIPWLTTFKDGIIAAGAAGKPLLLWTVNGHPLGCT